MYFYVYTVCVYRIDETLQVEYNILCHSGHRGIHVAEDYILFALTLPPEVHNDTLFYDRQRSYGLKTTTIGTATRIEVRRHLNRPDLIVYGKVILVVGKGQAERSTRIDYSIPGDYSAHIVRGLDGGMYQSCVSLYVRGLDGGMYQRCVSL